MDNSEVSMASKSDHATGRHFDLPHITGFKLKLSYDSACRKRLGHCIAFRLATVPVTQRKLSMKGNLDGRHIKRMVPSLVLHCFLEQMRSPKRIQLQRARHLRTVLGRVACANVQPLFSTSHLNVALLWKQNSRAKSYHTCT